MNFDSQALKLNLYKQWSLALSLICFIILKWNNEGYLLLGFNGVFGDTMIKNVVQMNQLKNIGAELKFDNIVLMISNKSLKNS